MATSCRHSWLDRSLTLPRPSCPTCPIAMTIRKLTYMPPHRPQHRSRHPNRPLRPPIPPPTDLHIEEPSLLHILIPFRARLATPSAGTYPKRWHPPTHSVLPTQTHPHISTHKMPSMAALKTKRLVCLKVQQPTNSQTIVVRFRRRQRLVPPLYPLRPIFNTHLTIASLRVPMLPSTADKRICTALLAATTTPLLKTGKTDRLPPARVLRLPVRLPFLALSLSSRHRHLALFGERGLGQSVLRKALPRLP